MTVQDMHYDFKMKLNKLDSQQLRNFLIPEIDWLLNEAQELFVKWVAEPRIPNGLGLETNQRNTDDIRMLMKVQREKIMDAEDDKGEWVVGLPDDYWHHVSGELSLASTQCGSIDCSVRIRQHDDETKVSPFDRSSILWREVNGRFLGKELRLEKPEDYSKKDFKDDDNRMVWIYLRKPRWISFAKGFANGAGYLMPGGVLVSSNQDCELPDSTHREIVDIAVMLASGQMQSKGIQFNLAKLNMNQLNGDNHVQS